MSYTIIKRIILYTDLLPDYKTIYRRHIFDRWRVARRCGRAGGSLRRNKNNGVHLHARIEVDSARETDGGVELSIYNVLFLFSYGKRFLIYTHQDRN